MSDHPTEPTFTTTDAGIPAPDDARSLTVGNNSAGPLLLHDQYLVQKMAQFNRGGGVSGRRSACSS